MIPAERSHLHVAATSHPGMRGKNNEDRYSVTAYTVGVGKKVPSVFAIVSDGVGGHRAGEVAATFAVEEITQTIAASDVSRPAEILSKAIISAGNTIREKAEADPSQKGMGATCACAWVIGNRLYTAAVGDSRIYLIRDERIRQLTIDHTWIQEALDFGALTPEQARGHPNAHVIRRYLGSQQPVTPDLRLRLDPGEVDEQSEANQGMRLHPGDILVLCSDGLTDLVEDSEILSVISGGSHSSQGSEGSNERLDNNGHSLEDALNELVKMANTRGGHDNITVVAMEMPHAKDVTVSLPRKRPKLAGRRVLPAGAACLGVMVVVFVALAAAWALGLWAFPLGPTGTPTVTSSMEVTATFTLEPTRRLATPTAAATQDEGISPPILDTLQAPTYTPWPISTLFPIQTATPQPSLP